MNWDQFWLTDEQFFKIEPHLPPVISGIVQVLKSGGRWIDAPPQKDIHWTYVDRVVR